MYADRRYAREIIKRVRFDEVRAEKAEVIAKYHGKQEATMFWDMLSLVIDEEYEHIIEQPKTKRRA